MSRSSTCYIKPQGLNYRATDILVWITAAFLRDLDFVTTAVITHFADAPAHQVFPQGPKEQRDGFFSWSCINALL
jgi:hypothetical protein